MLDAATKRRIDSARSILVGKVPDPKTQVEQITTALIYKFMNDMDEESIKEIKPLVMHQAANGDVLFQLLEKRNAVTFRKRAAPAEVVEAPAAT